MRKTHCNQMHNKYSLTIFGRMYTKFLYKLDYPIVSYFWQFISTIAWNCQGLSNVETTNSLKDLLDRSNPDIIFLSETKQQNKEMHNIVRKIHVYNYWLVPPRGTAGGLCLLWKNNIQITILEYDHNYINVNVNSNNSNITEWMLTCFYGSPYTTNLKLASWEIIKHLARAVNRPWIVLGDCNVVLHEEEKKSSYPFNSREADIFKNFINKCGLMDLGFNGYTFT